MSTRAVSWVARVVACVCLFGAAGCNQGGGNAAKERAEEPRIADFAPPPAPDLPGEPTYADEPVAGSRDDFEFSGAPARPPALEPRPERGAPKPGRAARERANAVFVVWEALAREKSLLEESRFKRRGPQPPQKITLVNSSHPEAHKFTSGRGRREYGHTAVLSDRDMQSFLKGIERRGFYRYARQVGDQSAVLTSENSRGRVTITRNGVSRTLVSMRGQGRDPRTKDIPRIYSETKQAIMVLKNMSPTLNVSHAGADPLRPR